MLEPGVVRAQRACHYIIKDFIRPTHDIIQYRYFEYNLFNKRTFSN